MTEAPDSTDPEDTQDAPTTPTTPTTPAMTPSTEPPSPFPFDAVVVADEGGPKNLSPAEFFALPLAHRIKYVVQQKAAFFAEGRAVDSRQVLGVMRKMRAGLH